MSVEQIQRHLLDVETLLHENSQITENTKHQIHRYLEQIRKCLPDQRQLLDETSDQKEESLNLDEPFLVWSDGACSGNPGPGGWGALVRHACLPQQELSGFSRQTTNQRMEMRGALEGILKTPDRAKIILTTDSTYLVKGMSEWIGGWKRKNWRKSDGSPVLNQDLWKQLDAEASKRTIKWQWVKGHAGHPENEKCDQLARMAIKKALE